MNDKVEIEKYAVNLFSEEASYGHLKVLIDKNEWWQTRISWLGEKVALELVLDWRDQLVTFLFVKLEEGKLPEGYFVSREKRCRYYIGKIVQEKPSVFCESEIKNIKNSLNAIRNTDSFKEKIDGYHDIIANNIAHILECEDMIFADVVKKQKRKLP